MKKLIVLIIIILMIPLTFTFNVKADVSTYYTMNLVEGYKYNLTTGIYEMDQGFTLMSKVQLRSTILHISSDTFTYLYVFDEGNNYLGFYGTQYTVEVAESLITYLGNISTGVIYLPAQASKMAIAVQTSAYNKLIDDPVTSLNNHSLRDVFENHDMLDNVVFDAEDLVGVEVADIYSFTTDEYTYFEIVNEGTFVWGVNLRTDMDINTHDYYINLNWKINNFLYAYNDWYFYDLGVNKSLITSTGFVGNVTTNYSTISSIPFGATTFYLQLILEVYEPLSIDFYRTNSVIVDLDLLGITLDESQMDTLLNTFINGKSYDPEDVLSSASFDLVAPYYWGADIPEDEDFSPERLIDRLLTKINLNTDFAKTIIAIGFMIITMVILALFKVPLLNIVAIGFIEYVMFTFMGWVEGWINIVLGIIIIVLGYIKFKGGSSHD